MVAALAGGLRKRDGPGGLPWKAPAEPDQSRGRTPSKPSRRDPTAAPSPAARKISVPAESAWKTPGTAAYAKVRIDVVLLDMTIRARNYRRRRRGEAVALSPDAMARKRVIPDWGNNPRRYRRALWLLCEVGRLEVVHWGGVHAGNPRLFRFVDAPLPPANTGTIADDNFELIVEARREMSERATAAHFGISRDQVRRFMKLAEAAGWLPVSVPQPQSGRLFDRECREEAFKRGDSPKLVSDSASVKSSVSASSPCVEVEEPVKVTSLSPAKNRGPSANFIISIPVDGACQCRTGDRVCGRPVAADGLLPVCAEHDRLVRAIQRERVLVEAFDRVAAPGFKPPRENDEEEEADAGIAADAARRVANG